MILALWIAVRMTFIAIEGTLAPAGEAMAALAMNAPEGRPSSKQAGQSGNEPERESGRGDGRAALADARQSASAAAWQGVPAGHREAQLAAQRPRRTAGGSAYGRWPSATAADFAAVPAGPPGRLAETASQTAPAPAAPAEGNAFTGPVLAYLAPADPQSAANDPAAGRKRHQRRWSADGWVLVRGGGIAPGLAAGTASYGGSQAGAVLRYALAPSIPLRPQAYARVSAALGGQTRQSEAAFGLMARPLRGVPLALLGEVRLQDQGGPVRARPVVMAVTELAPQRLPFGFEGEAYGQGGWAGGRGATLFFDMAATAQRRVTQPLPGVSLSAGGGVWSGGQRGAVRLDLGPRIELRGMVGPPSRRIGVRVGVDWRFRVAGKAEPGSGPALTVAAGF
ncbi:hypothetical protein [Novosphingobium sp. PASSN1]|uniref:hypothetical protein n=1 Tax=Novosphingobium sp. PASSN1 TaxID=2015561 RepID=UPI000BD2C067|nr:hypothetical protein [Novosphingobium sp. PASSN1]OYU33505.1 MAG: hypothetical protein CFE35_20235 [Novosphingobium sp. PASSN1]